MPRWHHWRMFDVMTKLGIFFFLPQDHPLFFLRLASSDRPKFLSFSKKKSNDVVKPFFTWNNSFNLETHIVINSIGENRNKNRNIFYSYIVYLNMWMLSFKVVLGYQGLLYSQTTCYFVLFVFFFQSDRPTQYPETHSTLNEKKNRMA